jgi:hypothetical protein
LSFDAVLLGDNHAPGVERTDDGVWVTYCGSTERASADEREDRGYNIVGFDDGVTISRRGLSTRPFVFVDLELSAGEGLERVRNRVDEYEVENAVAIVTIEGEGEPVAPAAVEERLRDRGALVARATDRRDTPAEAELDVSFSDPDEAVRERIRELGLSPAARDVDEVVRASKVADTAVAEEVERLVTDLLEAGEPDAFDPAPASTAGDADGPTTETAAERLAADAADGDTDTTDGGVDTADGTDETTASEEDTDENHPDGDDAETTAAETRTGTADSGTTDEPARQADWGDFS